MFQIAQPGTLYRTDVEVVVPQEKGGAETHDIVVLFTCINSEHYLEYAAKGDEETVRQIVRGWEGILDHTGKALPYTKENLNMLSCLTYFRLAVLRAYNERFAPRKNS